MTLITGIDDTPIRPSLCPSCGTAIYGALGPGRPSPGNIGLCGECGVISRLTDRLELRILTNAEWAMLSDEDRIAITTTREAILAAWKRK